MTPALSLFLIGTLFGATLNYFQFGFRTCSQELLNQGQTLGIRAMIIMLATSSVLFFGLLSFGSLNEQPLRGFVQPLSLAVIGGAFVFGMGMQLATGCTSGTLNRLGQLQPMSLVSFLALLVGGVMAANHSDFWANSPALPPVSVLQTFGLELGLSLQLAFLGSLYLLLSYQEKRSLGKVSPLLTQSIWKIGQWHPWLKAGILLALLNALLLAFSGQPWSIANVLPIWGLKLSDSLQVPIDWSFWSYGMTYANRIESSIFVDPVSLTTLGIIVGALLVTLLKPQLSRHQEKHPLKTYIMALMGGFLMGYGAVIASGCNIGAFFSGISSGSLHGWLWGFSALAGNAVIIHLRNRFA
ncbi:membrane protein [Thiosulfativibrio zosterae]|uniref:Membrane protein n=2 Tax=Thiosulfativibrio zosterae TaxID=2675053 RepID=A0A6F8PQ65_9GAMM|nr:membrane protein [Thiosulfativibrio zosterae]